MDADLLQFVLYKTWSRDFHGDVPCADSTRDKKYPAVWIVTIMDGFTHTVPFVNVILLSTSGNEITDFSK